MYYVEMTILSCIYFVKSNIKLSYVKKSISKLLFSFLDKIDHIDTYKVNDSVNEEHSFNYNSALLPHISNGVYKDEYELRKENTKRVLSIFYSSLYPTIQGVDYDITVINEKTKRYSLVFLENDGEKEPTRIPYKYESTGTKNLLAIFTYLFQAITSDNVLLIDEIDVGINDILLKTVIDSIRDKIKGQIIITTHNTLLLGQKTKKSCYILNREGKQIVSYSLDVYKRKIQENTNVVARYIKGMYGGIPNSKSFSAEELIHSIKNI